MEFQPPFPHRLPDPDEVGYPKAVERYLFRLRAFYNARAVWHRRFYRTSGNLVILVGAGLPVVVSLDYTYKNLVVSIMGVAVAVLTGLRSFYRWDRSWILLRSTEMAITAAWWDYKARVAPLASGTASDDEARDEAEQLLRRLDDIRQQESQYFFKDMKFPEDRGVPER